MVLSEIRQEARTRMQGLWGTCVPIWLIYLLLTMMPGFIFKNSFIQFVLNLVIGGPFAYGISKIFLRIYKQEPVEIGQLFEGFNDFTRTFTAYVLIMVYVLLWMILLVVPGIIAGLGYSMTFFIMAENPNIPAAEAMRKSKAMTMGYKWDLFWLGLSFIGWIILSILTMGIGLLWLESYIMTSYVIFYKKIKGREEREFVPENEEVVIHKDETVKQEEPEDIN